MTLMDSTPTASEARATPPFWSVLRPLDRPGWQPALIAFGAWLLILTGGLLHVTLSDQSHLFYSRRPEAMGIQGDFIILCILSAGFCYLSAVLIYQHRLYEQVLNDLRPIVDIADPAYRNLIRTRSAPNQLSMTIGALAGVGLSYLWLLLDPRVYAGDYNPWDLTSLGVLAPWHRVIGGLMGGAIGAFMNSTIHSAVFLSRLGAQLKPLDLFDLSPLRPFAQQGVANVLWLTGFTTIFATTYFLDPNVFLVMIVAFVVMNAILSICGLLLPVTGMARRIHTRKEIELDGIHKALKELGPARDLAHSGHLTKSAQLLAYRSFVLSVPIFPYTVTTFVRMGLFLLIPLWSWAASAVVGRGVGTLFGWE